MTFTVRPEDVRATLTPVDVAQGICDLHISFDFEKPTRPCEIRVSWSFPVHQMLSVWTPSGLYDRSVGPSWRKRTINSRQSSGAPVLSCISHEGRNILTVGISDAKTPISISAGIVEKAREQLCEVKFFTSDIAPIEHYEAIIRLDSRDIPFTEAVEGIAAWWEKDCGYPRAEVPESAYLPVNSTWYSYHQDLDGDRLALECELSRRYRLSTLIIDDGWQMANNLSGYSYCGDWQLAPEKIADMADLVRRIHKGGMKVMLWFSVPFIGVNSKAYEHFKHMALYHRTADFVADPRYPEMREYLIDCYARALREWDLDGFKLDFVDSIILRPESPDFAEGMDYSSVEDAVERLFADIVSTLSAIKGGLMFEFRQSYIGPSILKYGNMVRVGDCPYNSLRNRIAIIDLRLTSGKTAVHSDMLMWRSDESLDGACIQILSTLFGVPQISVKLDELPEEHQAALEFWMHFAIDHRETLQRGHLSVKNPELGYPQVRSATAEEAVTVNYASLPFEADKTPTQFFVNSTPESSSLLRFEAGNGGEASIVIRNCMGEITEQYTLDAATPLHSLPIPPYGIAELKRQ